MRSASTFLLAACLATTAMAQSAPAATNLLVTAAWLGEHSQDANLVLLHVGTKPEYDREHIPGAQFIALADIALPPDPSGNSLALELPPLAQLKEAFEKRGISDNSRIVVYFGQDWVSPSTRVIWTLNYIGMGDRTSLLDGGMAAWKATGKAVTAEVKTPTRGQLTPHLHPEIFADASWVAKHLHQPTVALVDARSLRDYNATGGHIPGAKSLPIEGMADDHNLLKDRAALTEMLRGAGVKPGAEVVSYCYVGQRATLIWFAAKLLGYEARMYDGSWDEWSRPNDLPVEVSAAHKQRSITFEKEQK